MNASTGKILIVDDHAGIRRLVSDVLRGFGVECIECSNGEGAVAAYAEFQPEWVTMDLEMPGLDGFATTARIRQINPKARVFILTQHDQKELRERARQIGAEGYLLKEELAALPQALGLLNPFDPMLNQPHEEAHS
jgi:CheY-like chemotaxis protein